jgi:hypothetical protein
MAEHSTDVGLVVLLLLLQAFSALVLAVTLHAITRDQDPDLALLGLVCRVTEGVIGGLSVPSVLALFWLATVTGAKAPEPSAAQALGAYLLQGSAALPATFFAVGSTFFAYLFLRGRMIPVLLAWLGVVASALLVVALPLQLAGFLHGMITQLVWLPMAAFEIPLAFWLLVKGVAAPAHPLPAGGPR